MGVYYARAAWITGIAFFVAFLLTLWPNRFRILTAAILWDVGMLANQGILAYDTFLRGGIAYAFNTSGGFPVFGYLFPLVNLTLALWLSALLFPGVSQARALFVGKILLLVVWPAFVLLQWWPQQSRGGLHFFPLGTMWLIYPVLWFRIRELIGNRSIGGLEQIHR